MVAGDLRVALGVEQDERARGDPLDGLTDVLRHQPGLQGDGIAHSHLEVAATEPPGEVLLARRADRDHAGDLIRGRSRTDAEKPSETRAAHSDARGIDA